VRPQLARPSNCLQAVGCLADDFDVLLSVEDHAKAVADERLVVGDQDADHVPAADGRRARTR